MQQLPWWCSSARRRTCGWSPRTSSIGTGVLTWPSARARRKSSRQPFQRRPLNVGRQHEPYNAEMADVPGTTKLANGAWSGMIALGRTNAPMEVSCEGFVVKTTLAKWVGTATLGGVPMTSCVYQQVNKRLRCREGTNTHHSPLSIRILPREV